MATHGRSIAVVMAMCVAIATSFPTGAPESACPSLVPDSHGPSTATGPSPYTLTVSSATYSPNQVLTVTLGGAAFKGFIIVGRVAGSTDPVGSFQVQNADSRTACTATPGSNGITHTNNTVKTTSSFQWQAPSSSVGAVTFYSTVVRGGAPATTPDKSDYFLGVNSASISPAGVVAPKIQNLKRLIQEKRERKEHAQELPFEKILANARPLAHK
jgi:hypothetical protein